MFSYKELCRTSGSAHRQAVVEALHRSGISFKLDVSTPLYPVAAVDSDRYNNRTIFRVKRQDYDRAVGALAESL